MKLLLLIYIIIIISIAGCSDNSTQSSGAPYDRGVSLAMAGSFEDAKQSFHMALQKAKNKSAAQGSLEVVKRVLSQHLDKEAAILFFKGIHYANKDEKLQAYSYFSNAIKASPDFADAHYERGLVNGRLKMYDQAISDFTKTIALNIGDTAAYNNRGLAYAMGLKEYDKAVSDFTKAIELDPAFAKAYDNRGIAYRIGFKDKDRACADWQKSCELNQCQSYELAKSNKYCN